jgi:hypothetical protein
MSRHPVERDPSTYATRHYDIVKEFVIAFVVVALLTAALAAVFSSPDEKPISVASWAKAAPNDFALTAVTELDGTSGTASYGPPYNNADVGQKLGPIGLQKAAGLRHPIDAAQAFVLGPLQNAPQTSEVRQALSQYTSASSEQQMAWASAYDDALSKAPDNDPTKVAPGDYGPVPTIVGALVTNAQSGSLDGALLSEGGFYQTDYTLPLMFVADGSYMADKASAQHLSGDQWGMMNETGNFPGQAWLWLYTFWYQVKPFSTSGNADALVWGLMMLLTLLFILLPFIPGLRSIPRWIPIYKLIWRDHYRNHEPEPEPEPADAAP